MKKMVVLAFLFQAVISFCFAYDKDKYISVEIQPRRYSQGIFNDPGSFFIYSDEDVLEFESKFDDMIVNFGFYSVNPNADEIRAAEAQLASVVNSIKHYESKKLYNFVIITEERYPISEDFFVVTLRTRESSSIWYRYTAFFFHFKGKRSISEVVDFLER